MNETWDLELFYEDFAGQMRRLDELIAQLELWCDTYTINHKKEETRLEDYAVLSQNFYELQEELGQSLALFAANESDTEWTRLQETTIAAKLQNFKETEIQINNWVRDIKNLNVLLINSPLIAKHRAHIEHLLEV